MFLDPRLFDWFGHLAIGGSQNKSIVPRDTKQDSAIRCFRDHQCRRAGKKFLRKHQVRALADSQHLGASRFVHFSQRVNEDPGCVYDNPGRNFQFSAALNIPKNCARDFVVFSS